MNTEGVCRNRYCGLSNARCIAEDGKHPGFAEAKGEELGVEPESVRTSRVNRYDALGTRGASKSRRQ